MILDHCVTTGPARPVSRTGPGLDLDGRQEDLWRTGRAPHQVAEVARPDKTATFSAAGIDHRRRRDGSNNGHCLRCSSSRAISGCAKPSIRDVGERWTAPQREALAQSGGGLGRAVVLERGCALADELFEVLDVELAGLDAKRVGAPVRLQPPSLAVAQPAPQLRHVVLQNLGGRGRRRLTPQRVDQPLTGDRLVAMQQQEHQDAALPPLADPDGMVLVIADLEGPEQAKAHASTSMTDRR